MNAWTWGKDRQCIWECVNISEISNGRSQVLAGRFTSWRPVWHLHRALRAWGPLVGESTLYSCPVKLRSHFTSTPLDRVTVSNLPRREQTWRRRGGSGEWHDRRAWPWRRCGGWFRLRNLAGIPASSCRLESEIEHAKSLTRQHLHILEECRFTRFRWSQSSPRR